MWQYTIREAVTLSGVGIHTGEVVTMTLEPASVDHGIVFERLDVLSTQRRIAVQYDRVSGTQLGTTITNEHKQSVSTIEHLMAALWACDIHNVLITLDGPEVPVLDGSSQEFIAAIEKAGIAQQAKRHQLIEVLAPIAVTHEGAKLRIEPYDRLVIDMTIIFDHPSVGVQHMVFDADPMTFKKDVAFARTFGFLKDIEHLRAHGLAKGGSLENAVVFTDDAVLNEEGLRSHDECVRHKILDCLGDLYVGGMLKGYVTGHCSGHTTNNLLLRALFEHQDAWRVAYAGGYAEEAFQRAVM